MKIRSDATPAARRATARTWRCGLLAVSAWIAGLFWFGAGAEAQTSRAPAPQLYRVKGIQVDVTAESAVAARQQAMTKAFTQALGIVEARLLTSSALAKVPTANAEQLLKDFEVTDEKVSSTRYIGTLTVRFDPNKVRRLLWSAGLPFSDTPSDPVLVLPVYEAGGPPVLFEAANPWLAAWTALPPEPRVVPLIMPGGDLDDLKAISASQALAGDAQAVGAIAARYNAQTVLVADAGPGDKGAGLNIRLLRIAPDGSSKDTLDVAGEPGEDPAALLSRGVVAVVTRVTDAWKSGAPQGPEHTLIASVAVSSLSDWIAVRKQIQAVQSVRSVEVKALSPSEAKVVLHYHGEAEALIADLAASGFSLTPAPAGTDGWVLRQEPAGGYYSGGQDAAAGTGVQPAPVSAPQVSGTTPASSPAPAVSLP